MTKIKYAFTGSHSTGKTTSVADLFFNQKVKHPTKQITIICDTARSCPLKINRNATQESQNWIFLNQMLREIEALERYDILITDRTVVDNIAYSKYLKFDRLVDSLIPLATFFISTYDRIFFKTIEKNNYLVDDGLRDCNKEYRQEIEDLMLNIYNDIFKKIGSSFNEDKFIMI